MFGIYKLSSWPYNLSARYRQGWSYLMGFGVISLVRDQLQQELRRSAGLNEDFIIASVVVSSVIQQWVLKTRILWRVSRFSAWNQRWARFALWDAVTLSAAYFLFALKKYHSLVENVRTETVILNSSPYHPPISRDLAKVVTTSMNGVVDR